MRGQVVHTKVLPADTGTDAIPYRLPAQQSLLEQVQKGLREIDAGGNSRGILVAGPSGTGKTTAMDLVSSLFLPYADGIQRCVPCCRVSAAAKSDTSSVAQSILRRLGKPLSATRNLRARELEAQVHAAIIACRVRIMIFEEMHNSLLATTKQLRGELSRFLKNLWNSSPDEDGISWAMPQQDRGDHRLIIIVSGTDEIRPVFDRDSELSSRYSCRINTPLLWFHPPESMRHFRAVFANLSARFGLNGGFATPDAALLSRTMFSCDAHLRRLEMLLSRAATLQSAETSNVDPTTLLSMAFEEVLQADASHENPFQWTHEDLKRRVLAAPKKHPRA